MIWRGAEKLARVVGIEFVSIKYDDFIKSDYPSDAVIYIHGGGGIHPNWSGSAMKAFLKAISSHCGVTILGPQTFPNDSAFLQHTVVEPLQNKGAGEAFIFTRECTSYAALKACLPGWIELGLDHDTALNLSANDLVTTEPARRFTFYAIRGDKESVGVRDRDLLAIWLDPVEDAFNFSQWVALHNRARKIVANRLHSAIVGSILGVPTTLLPNNYHKNRSVWEYSLEQCGVEWADEIHLGRLAQTINAVYPLRKLLGLSLFQRALRVFIYKARYRNLVP